MTTAVISKVPGTAVIARIEAATLRWGMAAQDGSERTAVRARYALTVLAQVGGPVTSDDVGQVHRGREREVLANASC